MSEYERNLHRFSDMEDVEVAEDDPDVRGWDVVTRDGRDVGEVKDLLVDTNSMKVRCLEVELEGSQFNWNDNRRVAIPVDSVRLDEEHDDVVVQGMGFDEIGRLEEYRPIGTTTGMPTIADELRGRDELHERDELRGRATPGSERDRMTRSEEEMRVGKREVEAGEVRVSKDVETEHISQPVTRARERVHVERRPVTEQTAGSASFEKDEIRVPVREEEVIVEKRPVVKEELVVSKERVEDTQNIEADIKKERFDIKKDTNLTDEGDDRLRGRR